MDEDVRDPLMQNIVKGMIFEEEEESIVQVAVSKILSHLLVVNSVELSQQLHCLGPQTPKRSIAIPILSEICVFELGIFVRDLQLLNHALLYDHFLAESDQLLFACLANPNPLTMVLII
jgi:hypothetical protein